jgi:uncharacterized protein with HEPN domain
MPKDFRVFLDDILEAIIKIKSYTTGMDYESFIQDHKTVDAVIRNLEIVGEAAKGIPENIRQNNQEIEWQRIIGLRNVLIHQYSGIDLEVVWDVIGNKLPLLEKQMSNILGKETLQ